MNRTGEISIILIIVLVILGILAVLFCSRFWSFAALFTKDKPGSEDGRDAGFEPFSFTESQGGHVVWYGASILHWWPLPDLGPGVRVEKVSVYGCPEKVEEMDSQLFARNPEVVILKLCSAYFSDRYMQRFMGTLSIDGHRRVIREMVELCRKKGVHPVLATVLPVTRNLSAPLWRNNNGNILAFNGWLRRYAAEEEIPLLDLAAVVSLPGGSLDPAYAQPDGLHISDEGYKRLNKFLRSGK